MSILSELNSLLAPLLPVETGVFTGTVPGEYVVITPMTDGFALFGDNTPIAEVSEVRLTLFSKGNYRRRKSQITSALLKADFTITDRRYVGHENDSGYHHYAIDVAKQYETEDF